MLIWSETADYPLSFSLARHPNAITPIANAIDSGNQQYHTTRAFCFWPYVQQIQAARPQETNRTNTM